MTTRPVLIALLLALAGAGRVAAQSALVIVDYDSPKPARIGDEVTSVIRFRALADLDELEVSVAADEGLEVISTPETARFQSVGKGQDRVLTVTVRITGPKDAALAIFFKSRRGERRNAGTSGINYPIARN
jgi:hypothetical protein